jgi:cytochrome c oxidase subunit 2
MRHRVVVLQAADFDVWVGRQKTPAVEPADGSPAAQGRAVFLARPCVGCHTIQGVAGGGLGPDLTHFGSRKTIAGGMLTPRDPGAFARDLARWLRNPPAVKPGSLMPDLGLAETEVTALVAYLMSLK